MLGWKENGTAFKMNFMKRIKKHFKEVIDIKTSNESIAIGFAIGTFIAILPTPGFNIFISALILLIFKRVSKISLFGALAIWNPITLIPIYTLSFKIGNTIFSSEPIIKYNIIILDQIYNFSRRFLVGNLTLAISLSIISYFIMLKIVEISKKKNSI